MAKWLTKFTVKASILGGAIYTTANQGLWKDTDSADEVYNNLYQTVAPYFKEVPVEMPNLPSTSCLAACSREYYNKGVIATVKFIEELPSQLTDWTVQGSNYLYNQVSLTISSAQDTSKKE